MQALITAEPNLAVVTDVPLPEPQAGEILVRVHAVALNPVDALCVAHPLDENFGRVVGSDFTGTVAKLGQGVKNWAIGDRVAACSINPRPGGFAEYAVLEEDLAFRIPDGVSFEEAATVLLCSLTAARALFIRLGLPSPFPTTAEFYANYPVKPTRTPTILIYSASTSVGLFVLSVLQSMITADPSFKINVIAIGSSNNHAKFVSLGAHHSFDYRDFEWQKKVLVATDGQGIDYAIDCLSEGERTAQISRVFGTGDNPDGIFGTQRTIYGVVWTGLGHDVVYDNGHVLESPPAHRQQAVDFKFLSAGSPCDKSKLPIEPNPVRLMPGGLAEVAKNGFELPGSDLVNERMKSFRSESYMKPIFAEKLVYSFLFEVRYYILTAIVR
ncbi:Zinc-type alcohol dehydrogenase-like protein C2E1P3.01 [Leucoagaricus sp. SymC.cos]|nr:Zinc-type alcohol dehydrogenase-like protein C2E1P3.01 [Leucoagaricus sp. SymC.cos]